MSHGKHKVYTLYITLLRRNYSLYNPDSEVTLEHSRDVEEILNKGGGSFVKVTLLTKAMKRKRLEF